MDGRQLRGLEIAENGRISKGGKGWIVPSQYEKGDYIVKTGANASCTCPDCLTRGVNVNINLQSNTT